MAVKLRHSLCTLVMASLIVLIIVGCSEPGGTVTEANRPSGAETEQPSGSVPGELLGRWNGGSNEAGHWYYEFYPDATYRAWPAYQDNPPVITGTVDVTANRITFSNVGKPFTVEWYISGGLLYMNQYSYVRA